MTAVHWFRRWLGAAASARGWADDCPAGLPVPEPVRCAAADCDSIPLTALALGERACVTCLAQPDGRAAAALSGLGVLPGVELELIACFPAFVFRIGYTELAVDDTLAGIVRVRRFHDLESPERITIESHDRFTAAS
jgi:ferrous iron transport protein A